MTQSVLLEKKQIELIRVPEKSFTPTSWVPGDRGYLCNLILMTFVSISSVTVHAFTLMHLQFYYILSCKTAWASVRQRRIYFQDQPQILFCFEVLGFELAFPQHSRVIFERYWT